MVVMRRRSEPSAIEKFGLLSAAGVGGGFYLLIRALFKRA
jgi:hypothetical protein